MKVGTNDALIGDEIPSSDLQSNKEIITKIKYGSNS